MNREPGGHTGPPLLTTHNYPLTTNLSRLPVQIRVDTASRLFAVPHRQDHRRRAPDNIPARKDARNTRHQILVRFNVILRFAILLISG